MAKKSKRSKKRGKSKRSEQSKALQERIQKGQMEASAGKSVINKEVKRWMPKDGDHLIDILPYKAGKNDPKTKKGKETYTFQYSCHRQVGPANVVVMCLAEMKNSPCPICEDRQRLIEKGADDTRWKPLFPKVRNMYNVICYDRGEEEKGVQVWDVPNFYSEKHLLAIATKPKRGGGTKFVNFPDIDEGKTVSFKIVPAQSRESYPSYEGYSFEDRDYDLDEDLLDDCETLDEIVQFHTYDEVSDLYYGDRGGKKKRDDDDDYDEDEEMDTGRERDDDDDKSTGDDDLDDIMEELDDCEDIDDLKEFIDDYDLEFKFKKKTKFKKAKTKIEALVLEKYGDSEVEESEEEEEEDNYTWKDIKKMKTKQLKKLIKKEDLDVDPDDADDTDELREMVAEELEIDVPD